MRIAAVALAALVSAGAGAQEEKRPPIDIPAERYEDYRAMIKPGEGAIGENKYLEAIPWRLQLWEARKEAIEKGMPLLFCETSCGHFLSAS